MAMPPLVDDGVTYVQTSYLRSLNAETLQALDGPLVIQVREKPVAVIIPYEQYLEMQKAFWPSSLFDTLDRFINLVDGGRLSDALARLEGCVSAGLVRPTAPVVELPAVAPEAAIPPNIMRCVHCGDTVAIRPGPSPPCNQCFLQGHRSGNCVKCAELEEAKRRASQDSTGAERDDVDRMAFDKEVS